jgi:hypothetical protein
MAVDWSDACARATALRTAYFELVSGTKAIEIETRTLDAQEKVRFTTADKQTLLAALRAAEAECAASTGGANTNRRFAIGMSYRG